MPLVSITDLTIGFRGPPLLDGVSCAINAGERIGLLGRNGAGKTTLLKMIGGTVDPDDGSIIIESGRHVATLQQDVPAGIEVAIEQVVADGLSKAQKADDGHRADPVARILSIMELNGYDSFASLSSGMKRRVLLAKALVSEPDLLLLDEPTNHLDVWAIEWLEKFLLRFGSALMFVTHDRMFLRRMANRILEIDRGRLFDWTCDYETFLKRKADALAVEERENALFDKKLALEEVWIRQGIKARRTRNEGRVRSLKKLREERGERRGQVGTSNLRINSGEKSGQLVAEMKEISFAYPDSPPVIQDFSATIMRGDKVGIIGPNGAGKSTLLKILLGQLQPTSGSIRLGTNLQVAYFDQLREQLDGDQTIEDNVGEGSDNVMVNGAKKHIYGYLQDFLFTPERARTQIKFLSGGERNRILLAKLFSKPANLIVMDEPTNDLDYETLEMLEERLVAYAGTVLLVSHDRAFLNNVVTNSIVFEDGNIKEYVGGFDDWMRQRKNAQAAKKKAGKKPAKQKGSGPASAAKKVTGRKMKYADQKELEQLPAKLEKLEAQIGEYHTLMADPDFYQQEPAAMAAKQEELKKLEEQLATAYKRWEELEAMAS